MSTWDPMSFYFLGTVTQWFTNVILWGGYMLRVSCTFLLHQGVDSLSYRLWTVVRRPLFHSRVFYDGVPYALQR